MFVFHCIARAMSPVLLLGVSLQGAALGVSFSAVPIYLLETTCKTRQLMVLCLLLSLIISGSYMMNIGVQKYACPLIISELTETSGKLKNICTKHTV
jgi:hypothetical protein